MVSEGVKVFQGLLGVIIHLEYRLLRESSLGRFVLLRSHRDGQADTVSINSTMESRNRSVSGPLGDIVQIVNAALIRMTIERNIESIEINI